MRQKLAMDADCRVKRTLEMCQVAKCAGHCPLQQANCQRNEKSRKTLLVIF